MQPTPQFDLFASAGATPSDEEECVTDTPSPAAQAVLDAVEAIDPDAMSPREALEALFRLRQLANPE